MDVSTARMLAIRLFEARKPELNVQAGPRLTRSHAASFKKHTSHALPPDLEAWLTICNGCTLNTATVPQLLGLRSRPKPYTDVTSSLTEPHWRKQRWIPIATDGCGQTYFLLPDKTLKRNIVCFHEAMSEPDEMEYVVASSLWHFLAGVFSEPPLDIEPSDSSVAWPFDRTFAKAFDPDLSAIKNYSKPWS